jgi:hypothetical protein
MEWLAMFIPFVAIIVLFVFFKKKTIWWEASIPLGVTALFILIFKLTAEHYMTTFDEYWTGHIVKAEYYEPWNEYIHQTCTRKCCCDSDGNNCSTETYDCSYVKNHPEQWVMYDNNGIEFSISKQYYNYLIKKFKTKPTFVDLRRNYHTRDGDKYEVYWNNNKEDAEIVTSVRSYENRVRVSRSVFNFQEISKEEKEIYKLYDYPKVENLTQKSLLGYQDKKAERNLDILNGFLGKEKEVKAFILIFKNQPIKAAELQEAYWKGGNKNEFITCVGIDSLTQKIDWVYVISWNTNKILNINVRDWVYEQKKLNLTKLVDYLYVQIEQDFQRKQFREFSYLKVELTSGQILAVWIVSFILSLGISIWIILNPFEDNPRFNHSINKNRYNNFRIRF